MGEVTSPLTVIRLGWCQRPRGTEVRHEPLRLLRPELEASPRARAGVPVVPHWTLPRRGAQPAPRRRRGRDGHPRVRVRPARGRPWVSPRGPPARPRPPGLVWLNLARGGAEPGPGVAAPASGSAGGGRAAAPTGAQKVLRFAPARTRALVELGEALSDRGPWTVVLDGYPDRRRRASSDRSSRSCSTTPVGPCAWSCSASRSRHWTCTASWPPASWSGSATPTS